ncbi:serine/threonine dehydratase [Sphaerisporangium melleum]|uniref:threonine ammonia-lyase n=1 Tax=Sphaerisporangium melleum TaxID=321316 RepID=A0A917VCG6_9ACTN|nr:pyridoxal-phosphate dependent enzyme [Sphaerisporangium melleum]GGK64056.1 serine/threonine dehydratase [Sphaerisporangium melleum]GII70128.1 serine/threonine dehydratase [Sphaerisporangium melleum]
MRPTTTPADRPAASAAPPPSITDVLRAARLIAPHLPETPMWSYPVLNAHVGAEVHVKHENVQPTGAFKVRGGLTLLAGLPAAQGKAGVLTYSTGNHAQSIAYAARLYGLPCTIVMPENPNPAKVAAVEALGAAVEISGATMVEAAVHARSLAEERGDRLISPADEPGLIAGVGTLYLEMLARVPDLDAVFVPVGSGTGAAAACLVAAAVAPRCRVIAVQSALAPAAHDSWRSGAPVRRAVGTVADGLATGSAFALPQSLMRGLHDFVLVHDDDLRAAQRVLLTEAHTLTELAGAAALAGLLARKEEFTGRKVAVVCSGANAGPAELRRLLA